MRTIAAFNCLIILVFVIVTPTLAQSQIDSLKRTESTLPFSTFFNPLIHLEDSFFSNEINNLRINTNFFNDTSSIWIRTRLKLNELVYQESFGSNLQSNILNPLNQQYNATQNLKLFRSILGAVSVSAVGYLAYQHIKKYGFLKKR